MKRLSDGNWDSAKTTLIAVMAFTVAAACTTMAPYDPVSYQTAAALKADSLHLMTTATEPPTIHTTSIRDIRTRLGRALDYERGKGDGNSETVRQWELLIDPARSLLGGFLAKWEREEQGLSLVFVQETSKNVGGAFDEIIRLERRKARRVW